MGRGVWGLLVFGLAGVILILVSGFPGKFGQGRMGDHSFPSLPCPTSVSPSTPAGDEVAGQALQAEFPAPEVKPETPGARGPAATGHGNRRPSRRPPRISNLVTCQNLEKIIRKYARQYGLEEDLVWAVIRQESGFNPEAVSPQGAMGLMQLMPGTAARMGVSDAFDVEQNIAGGIKYLDRCLNQFNRDVGLALAAYNAGPDNVEKYQGCPPFPETRQYVASVLQAYAGGAIRDNLILVSHIPVTDAEVSDPAGPRGLSWRIPRPSWKIAAPRCKLGSPRWQMTVRPF